MKTVGRIYRIKTVLTKPPKEKIVLYVGNDLFFWFNTDARQRPGQMEVNPGDCPAITHKCYLDCGRVTTFSDREVQASIVCGDVDAAFIKRVVEEVVERATVLVGAHRKLVAETLTQCYPEILDDEE